jgi:hypothetical protein
MSAGYCHDHLGVYDKSGVGVAVGQLDSGMELAGEICRL